MNTDHIVNLGVSLAKHPEVRAAAKKLASKIPAGALAFAGIGGTSTAVIAGGVLGAFAVGTATGVALVLLMGPNGDQNRKELLRRVGALRKQIVQATRRATHEVQVTTHNRVGSPFHVPSPDDTLIPRA